MNQAKDGLQSWCKDCMDRFRGIKKKIVRPPEGHRHCYRCNQTKPLAEFYTFTSPRGGNDSRCKKCIAEIQKKYRAENPVKTKEWNTKNSANHKVTNRRRLLRKFGLTEATFETQLASQNGCAICHKSPKGRWPVFSLDHCHRSGRFRGILCGVCNSGLGYFRDSPTILRAAADYLERHQLVSSA